MSRTDDRLQADSMERHWKVLDLPSSSDGAEIERQYTRLRRLYSPDKLEDQEDQAYARAKLEELDRAYEALIKHLPEQDTAQHPSVSSQESGADGDDDEIDTLFCANHPDRETLLRCNKCGKPICMDCAVQTPVGYRCKECVYEQQNVYYNAATQDNLIAFGVGFVVAAIGAPIVGMLIGGLGFFIGLIIAFVIGSGAGSVLAQIIRRAVGGRRGRKLPLFALAGIVLGVLIGNLAFAVLFGSFPLLSPPMLLFTALAIGAAYPQLR